MWLRPKAFGPRFRRLRSAVASGLAWVRAEISAQELYLWAGLMLLGAGGWQVHPALGLVLPGVVLVWFAMPSRPPLVVPLRASATRRRRAEEDATT